MNIDELEKLLKEADDGPWMQDEYSVMGSHQIFGIKNSESTIVELDENHRERNLKLIVALRNKAEKMIAVIKAAKNGFLDGYEMHPLREVLKDLDSE